MKVLNIVGATEWQTTTWQPVTSSCSADP